MIRCGLLKAIESKGVIEKQIGVDRRKKNILVNEVASSGIGG